MPAQGAAGCCILTKTGHCQGTSLGRSLPVDAAASVGDPPERKSAAGCPGGDRAGACDAQLNTSRVTLGSTRALGPLYVAFLDDFMT